MATSNISRTWGGGRFNLKEVLCEDLEGFLAYLIAEDGSGREWGGGGFDAIGGCREMERASANSAAEDDDKFTVFSKTPALESGCS